MGLDYLKQLQKSIINDLFVTEQSNENAQRRQQDISTLQDHLKLGFVLHPAVKRNFH